MNQLELTAVYVWLSPNYLPFVELKLCGADVLMYNPAALIITPYPSDLQHTL